jgi:hypothetical protein
MSSDTLTQIRSSLNSSPHKELIEKLYHLHVLVTNSILAEDYQVNPAYAKCLVPSEYALSILSEDISIEKENAPESISLVLLDIFFHEHVLIDPIKSDINQAITLFSNDIKEGKVKLPYRYGRVLYDKFNDDFNDNQVRELEFNEVSRLLENTEQGVYQIGNLVAGPLGIMVSQETRHIPPRLDLPLWHCSDTGCNYLHSVDLLFSDNEFYHLYSSISILLMDSGPVVDWSGAFESGNSKKRWLEGRPFIDINALIGDAILEKERTALLMYSVQTDKEKIIRNELSRSQKKKSDSEGTAEQVAMRFNESAQLQLLLLMSDKQLVHNIDNCVALLSIKVPANEVRKGRTGFITLSDNDSICELSSYGLRSAPDDPLVSLIASIWDAFEQESDLATLAWRCDKSQGKLNRGIVTAYVRNHTPQEVIKNLVLPSKGVLEFILNRYVLSLVKDEEDDVLIERILWKVGFDVARYEDKYDLFRRRLSEFNETLIEINVIKSESDRATIRKAGVNVFVSLESIIEEIISYNIWILSSDHFVNTRFVFNRAYAFKRVAEVLGESIQMQNHSVSWNTNGGNVLGTSLVYLSATSTWLRSLATKDSESLKRPLNDLPHFADVTERIFPFLHTELWADSAQDELISFSGHFDKISSLFSSSHLAEIRNGLDHNRDSSDFPSIDAMMACYVRLSEAFNLADANRLLPKTYWVNQKNVDIYGRTQIELRDYRKRPINMHGPSGISGMPGISFDKPMIIPSGNLLGIANAEIPFHIQEVSAYSKYWDGYPRRRTVVAKVEIDNLEDANELEE